MDEDRRARRERDDDRVARAPKLVRLAKEIGVKSRIEGDGYGRLCMSKQPRRKLGSASCRTAPPHTNCSFLLRVIFRRRTSERSSMLSLAGTSSMGAHGTQPLSPPTGAIIRQPSMAPGPKPL